MRLFPDNIRVSERDIAEAKKIDVEDYITQYVIPKNKAYFEDFNRASMIRCPLHDENTPSFKVYQDTNTWSCFAGCGGGDIISFIMKYENIGFKDAVLFLLDIAGVESTFVDSNAIAYGIGTGRMEGAPQAGTKRPKIKINEGVDEVLIKATDKAELLIRASKIKNLEKYEKFCRLLSIAGMTKDKLVVSMNDANAQYSKEFNVLDDAYTDYVSLLNIEKFKESAFANLLPLRGFHTESLLEVLKEQLASYVLEGREVQHTKYAEEMYTFGCWSKNTSQPIFFNSYLLPIFGINNQVLGITSYQPTGKSKYLYATSPYVNRNDLIYHKRGFKDWGGVLIVCEGVFDALRLMSLGFDNAISTLGAHESLLHKRVLSQAEHLVLIPDRDDAGRKIAKYWKACNANSSILYVPYGRKDLDEFCSEGIFQEQLLVNELNKALARQIPGQEYAIILD